VPNSRGSDVDHWDTYAPNGGSLDSEAALAITDSMDNYAFDMHAYQDFPDSSTSYVELLTPVTDWATTNGKRLFLSELGVANGAANGEAALGNLLEYLNDNNNVWIGWTFLSGHVADLHGFFALALMKAVTGKRASSL
jgi:endoglucanase